MVHTVRLLKNKAGILEEKPYREKQDNRAYIHHTSGEDRTAHFQVTPPLHGLLKRYGKETITLFYTLAKLEFQRLIILCEGSDKVCGKEHFAVATMLEEEEDDTSIAGRNEFEKKEEEEEEDTSKRNEEGNFRIHYLCLYMPVWVFAR
ncbi:hypothetical protein LOAG_04556 [Loa loa]|uniref:Uncharacterized protein n=1 Tax=Loa loa TaxID=7209 RepID=A0A1S0U1W2_LOALO|nr:hypothetical protein LOAG_04556 [Loa loa]EFO23932.1 hypothetical protein LOAG_04556 [Loa loa]